MTMIINSVPMCAPSTQRTYTEELITPELAAQYLQLNTHNRSQKDGRIAGYAADMRSGNWRVNGEAIKFSVSGKLLDGQNRLQAVIRAGVPVSMLVVRGLEDSDQEAMDIGAIRTLSDVLALRGEKNQSGLGATVRALYLWTNCEDPSTRVMGGSGQGGGHTKYLSNSVFIKYFEENSEMCRYICAKADKYRRTTRIPISILAPLLFEMECIDQADSEDFMHRIENLLPSPKNYGEQDPMTQLYKRMRQMMDNTKARYIPTELGALIVKAWNAYRDGAPIVQLRWRTGGSSPEAFPVMK